MMTMMIQIYNELMHLCDTQDGSFFFVDFPIEGSHKFYRIFNYRLATYTQFTLPSALESRGIMFLIDPKDGISPRIICRPMEKFFNLGENPFTDYTIDQVVSSAAVVMDKADGSLISSYIDINGDLKLKSKGSLTSDQALAAMEWLKGEPELLCSLYDITEAGFTVNMEWVSPNNRIVLGYDDSRLIVLNARNNATGAYLGETCIGWFASKYLLEYKKPENIKNYRKQEGIEGYVVRLSGGQHIKLKTDWYITRHHCKDNINSQKKLFEAVLDEATDDLKQMFDSDPHALMLITKMENLVIPWYDHFVNTCETFFKENKHLGRKDFAIKAKNDLQSHEFHGVMTLYKGAVPDYKGMSKKNYEMVIGV